MSMKSWFSNIFKSTDNSNPDNMHPQSLYELVKRNATNDNLINFPWDRPDYEEEVKQLKEKHKEKFAWLFDPKKGVRWDFDPIYIRNLTHENTIAELCIENITKEVSNIPWDIVEDDDPEISKCNPFERKAFNPLSTSDPAESAREFFDNPNDEQSFSDIKSEIMNDLLEIGSTAIALYFSEDDYDGDVLSSDDPTLMKMKTTDPITFTKDYKDKTGILQGFWQYQRNRSAQGQRSDSRTIVKPIYFNKKEIVWDDLNSRSYRRYGLPPTLMILPYLELQDLTIEQEQRYFSRGMISPGALVFEELDNKEIEDVITMMESNMKGHPEKKVILGGDGGPVDYVPFSFNYKELEYNERQQWYAKIIASAFQVPMSVLGLKPEDVNRATFEGERRNFENNALGPYLQKLERMFTHQIVKPFFDENLRFEFKPGLSEESRSVISERITREWSQNLITRDEARQQLGYSAYDEDEDIFNEDTGSDEGVSGFPAMMSSSMKQDEPMRETDNWHLFSVQPSDVENLKSNISGKVGKLWDEILSDDEIMQVIERNITEKTGTISIARRLKEIFSSSQIVRELSNQIKQHSRDEVEESLSDLVQVEDVDVDEDAILDRIDKPTEPLIENHTERIEREITDVVSEGWQEGSDITDIREKLQEKREDFTENQAETIARTELHNASSKARNEFAKQTDRVEVWITSDDRRVRDAHSEMDGKWKYPNEVFPVTYETSSGTKTKNEEFPGNSKFGINCRCDTILEREEDVDESDHVGVER